MTELKKQYQIHQAPFNPVHFSIVLPCLLVEVLHGFPKEFDFIKQENHKNPDLSLHF